MTHETIQARNIKRVWTAQAQQHNDIHKAAMVLEPDKTAENDPFLFLAEDWFGHGTFDVHPHRGIETVTYVIEGKLSHYDNRFGDGELEPGDVQWMTAGRGVIHKEDPDQGEQVHSLQLWVNLPRDQKLTEPRYQNLRAKDMPLREEPGVRVRVFSGSSGDLRAQTQNYVPVTMVEMNLEAGAQFRQDLPGDYNGFIYMLEGSGTFGANAMAGEKGQTLLLGGAHGAAESAIEMRAQTPLKALLYAGRPLHEPVVSYGPFVMNTRQQIVEAIDDYQNGRFAE